MLSYWFLVTPAVLLSAAGLLGQQRRSKYIIEQLAQSNDWTPPATVIVPVKGPDEGLRENLAALASLDYPDYELLVVAQTAADIPVGVLPRNIKVVLAHGGDASAGEKVRNLQAAVRAVSKRSEVFAFADSDGRPSPRWLRALVAPLQREGVGASTGFRWFTPQPATFWSLMAGVWNSVVSGMLGPGDNAFAWGGAMAMRKETFYAAHVPEFWKGTVSDDYALSAAVHAAKLTIAYAPGALTPTFDRPRAIPFFRWIARQMTITRVYYPRLWQRGLIAHLLYCVAMTASLIELWRGYRPAAAAFAVQLLPGMIQGGLRARLARRCLPESAAWFRRNSWTHVAFVPLGTWVWLISFLTSAWSNIIEWRGHSYDLSKMRKTSPRRS